MKCLSRSTFGIAIGVINIIICIGLIFYITSILWNVNNLKEEEQKKSAIWIFSITLVACIIGLIISVLFVLGIVKQRHTLMMPWIYTSLFGYFLYVLRIIIGTIVALTKGMPFVDLLSMFFIELLKLSVNVLLFYPIYVLYVQIRDAKKRLQNPSNYSEMENGE